MPSLSDPDPRVSDSTASDDETVIAALRSGDIRACARLITRIERGDARTVSLLQALYRAGRRSPVVGITGPPGAGKSTLSSRLVAEWRRRGRRVAVLAVDPSSPFSGGAVLGDRLRMMEHGCDEGVFIRSMASRGRLGGLAKATGDVITVLDAMPWDVILVETVGVGQNETDIIRHAGVAVLLQTPMGGDDVQAAKAGITEIGDIFVVNKSDHPDADRTVRQLRDMIDMTLCLNPGRPWSPVVVKTCALDGTGITELVNLIDRCLVRLEDPSSSGRVRQRARVRQRVGELLHDMLEHRLRSDRDLLIDASIDPVIDRDSDPYALAASILARLDRTPT